VVPPANEQAGVKSVLITGCSGEIGSALVRTLLLDPEIERVVGVDVRPPDGFHGGRFDFTARDVREPLDALLRQHRIHTVVHAAFVVHPIHNTALQYAIDVAGTRSVVQSAAAAKVESFVHLSSATVYGAHADQQEPIPEESPPRPNRGFVYAENKVAAEGIVEQFRREAAFRAVTVLRPSFVAGPNSRNALFRHISRRFAVLPGAQSPLQLTHIEDLIEILRRVIHRTTDGIFNVGADGALTASQMMARLHNYSLTVPYPALRSLGAIAWKMRLSWLTNVPEEAIALLRHPWRVKTQAVQSALDFRFRYDTRAAFEDFAEAELRKRFTAARRTCAK